MRCAARAPTPVNPGPGWRPGRGRFLCQLPPWLYIFASFFCVKKCPQKKTPAARLPGKSRYGGNRTRCAARRYLRMRCTARAYPRKSGAGLAKFSCVSQNISSKKSPAAERRDAQDELHSATQARAWADGDFDADHGLAFDGVGRPAHKSRARGPIGVGAADVRTPLLCISLLHQKKSLPSAQPHPRLGRDRSGGFGCRSRRERPRVRAKGAHGGVF
jgi:hypothetical protein